MKYKEGDLVRIKPFEWFKNEYSLDKFGNIKFYTDPGFVEEMKNHCGMIGTVEYIHYNNNSNTTLTILTNNNDNYNWLENWIDKKIEKYYVSLKLMKNEI